ncbi:hypothetical protein [Yoonia sp. 208BN28-4]|uniref:hypothetical protein n=1 Tax=Yoonia sp. 208BN28-4 TaxID=3126505 RepID=UPI0030ABEAA7
MTVPRAAPLPDDALLRVYTEQGAYTDCFVKDVANDVDLAGYLMGFYTTPLFRVERLILRLALKRPSTDADVAALARKQSDSFAAWDVEARTEDQVLLCDMGQATRSWFKVARSGTGTRLYFGSAVVAPDHWLMRALLPLHRLYARALLWSVRKPSAFGDLDQ